MKQLAVLLGLSAFLLCVTPANAQSTQTDTATRVFEVLEVEASVDAAAWRSYLQEKLTPLVKKAAKKLKPGVYTVNVRFLVEKDGTISEAVALNDLGYELGESAAKVVKSGPLWTAGEQNGKKVRSYHTQPITFEIQK